MNGHFGDHKCLISCRPAAPGVVIPEDLSFMGDAKAEKAKRERESEREKSSTGLRNRYHFSDDFGYYYDIMIVIVGYS